MRSIFCLDIVKTTILVIICLYNIFTWHCEKYLQYNPLYDRIIENIYLNLAMSKRITLYSNLALNFMSGILLIGILRKMSEKT